MAEVIKVNVDDLDSAFLEELKAQYAHSTLEIHVHKAPGEPFTAEAFWQLIGLMDWENEGDDEAVVAPVIEQLSQSPLPYIYRFYDLLAEYLWKLDTQQHAQPFLDDPDEEGYLSVDDFLYARCAVVANGRAYYNNVLFNPNQMPTQLTFEPLLYIAGEAYERKTGMPFRAVPAYNFETYSNTEGWV